MYSFIRNCIAVSILMYVDTLHKPRLQIVTGKHNYL